MKHQDYKIYKSKRSPKIKIKISKKYNKKMSGGNDKILKLDEIDTQNIQSPMDENQMSPPSLIKSPFSENNIKQSDSKDSLTTLIGKSDSKDSLTTLIGKSDSKDSLTTLFEKPDSKENLTNDEELKYEKNTYIKMLEGKNKKKFCYYKPEKILLIGTRSYIIKKLLISDKESCTYLTKDIINDEYRIIKQYPKKNDSEYKTLEYIKKNYELLSFPFLKYTYKSKRFLYLVYKINIDENSLSLNDLISSRNLESNEKKQIIKQLNTLMKLLLKINVLHKFSLDDIFVKKKEKYDNIELNEICIINFNNEKCKIFNLNEKKDYEKWLYDMLSNITTITKPIRSLSVESDLDQELD